MVFYYTVKIEVDDSVIEKYHNYSINYNSHRELADSIAFSLEREGETDMRKDGMKEWGYSIKVEKVSL